MKKRLLSLLTALMSLTALSGCRRSEPVSSDAPQYTGMSLVRLVSNEGESPVREELTSPYIMEQYGKYEIKINFSNSKNYEIASFYLNDKKYDKEWFSEGSTNNAIYFRIWDSDDLGEYSYEIYNIRYKDGDTLKPCRIAGNTTLKATTQIPGYKFGGVKVATSLVDGESYYFGMYRREQSVMRFINGSYHRTERGTWSYYMATTKNTLEGAAQVKVRMVGNDEFTLQVIAPGMDWDQKYIGVYLREKTTNNFVSQIACLNNPDDQTFTSYYQNSSETVTTTVVSRFKYYEKYRSHSIYTIGATYPATAQISEPFIIYFGTSGTYVTIDCQPTVSSVESDSFDLAHLYKRA